MIPAGFIIPHVCPVCTTTFSDYRCKKRKHCSSKCADKAKQKKTITLKCAKRGCPNTFYKRGTKRFCCISHSK